MNKIITVALASAKPSVEALLEIINATSNPTVATEILLGIYEDPTVNPEPASVNDAESNVEFQSYDKFTEQVTYSYTRVKTVTGWILNTSEVKVSNIANHTFWPEDAAAFMNISVDTFKANYTRHTIVTGEELNRSTNSMSLKKWNTGSSK